MTNREFYTIVASGNLTEDAIKYAAESIEKLDARNANRSNKPTKAQLENAPIKQAILDHLMSCGEALTERQLGDVLGITHNKAGSLARQLVSEGKLTSGEVKLPKVGRRKVYSFATEEVKE